MDHKLLDLSVDKVALLGFEVACLEDASSGLVEAYHEMPLKVEVPYCEDEQVVLEVAFLVVALSD